MQQVRLSLAVMAVLTLLTLTLNGQNTYYLNGSLGLDTVPEHTHDVNGDGHFRGELLVDDDLRLLKLASTDTLLERLLYIDDEGRMHRLGEDGARSLLLYLSRPHCLMEEGQTEPTVFWQAFPGRIVAHDDNCPDFPDVGIGTSTPEARLDVRGTGYFQRSVGIGLLNNDDARLLVRTSGSLPALLVKSNQNVNGTPTEIDILKLHANGHLLLDRTHANPYAIGLDINTEENNLKALRLNSSDEEVFMVWGDGRLEQNVSSETPNPVYRIRNTSLDGSPDMFRINNDGYITQRVENLSNDRVFRLRNLEDDDQDLFNLRGNGRMQMRFVGDDENLQVLRIERGNAPVADDFSHILSVRGTGRTQINYTGSESSTAFVIRDGADSDSDRIFQVYGDGSTYATSVHVRLKSDFPDYVFEPGYELMPLEKLRRYIADHQRLPNMPAAEEVQRGGLDLGETNRPLVEKVEGLTLYVLQLEERLKALETR